MTIVTNSNNTGEVRPGVSDQLRNTMKKFNRELCVKGLLTLAALVVGIALVIFVSNNLLTFGVSLIIVSVFAAYYHFNQYSFLNGLYKRVVVAIDERLKPIENQ